MSQDENIALSKLFDLEVIEQGLFRGQSWDLGFRALFGGQVLAQALIAATKTVVNTRFCHSFHTYFLMPGDATKPVVYDVENVRDGRSFCTRRVKAIQNGRNIFYMTASFQVAEDGLNHQHAQAPEVVPPESLEPDIDRYARNVENLSSAMREVLAYHKPIDFRSTKVLNKQPSDNKLPTKQIWLRATELLSNDFALNQAVLAYASDYHFLTTALAPHNISPMDKRLTIATIDHAMWFHRPVNMNEWLLYSTESPFSGNGRGYVRGQFFDLQGNLVASATQEGLVRVRTT